MYSLCGTDNFRCPICDCFSPCLNGRSALTHLGIWVQLVFPTWICEQVHRSVCVPIFAQGSRYRVCSLLAGLQSATRISVTLVHLKWNRSDKMTAALLSGCNTFFMCIHFANWTAGPMTEGRAELRTYVQTQQMDEAWLQLHFYSHTIRQCTICSSFLLSFVEM